MATRRGGKFGREAVRGLKETRGAFKRITPTMQKHLWRATNITAIRIEQAAGRRVRVRTGALAEAIGSSFSKKTGVARVGIRRGAVIIAGRGGSALTRRGAKVLSPIRYAHLVEFGTVHSRAFPFMLNSAEEQRLPYLARTRQAGKDAEAEMAARAVRVV